MPLWPSPRPLATPGQPSHAYSHRGCRVGSRLWSGQHDEQRSGPLAWRGTQGPARGASSLPSVSVVGVRAVAAFGGPASEGRMWRLRRGRLRLHRSARGIGWSRSLQTGFLGVSMRRITLWSLLGCRRPAGTFSIKKRVFGLSHKRTHQWASEGQWRVRYGWSAVC